ncbi:MAG: hypothetical protein OXH59_02545, partial [Rhodospirillaceae bacterium]|nr:hypothetical protein [Rhodospirillaceae bacterium]
AGRFVSDRRDPSIALRDNRTPDETCRAATIKTENGLEFVAALRNDSRADAARNLILVVARPSPRSSRYTVKGSSYQTVIETRRAPG